MLCLVIQSCPTLCNPMNHRLPGSSVHGILQARILEWVSIAFSRISSHPRDWTQVSPSELPGNPMNTGVGSLSWRSQGSSWPRKWTRVSYLADRLLTSWATVISKCNNNSFSSNSMTIQLCFSRTQYQKNDKRKQNTKISNCEPCILAMLLRPGNWGLCLPSNKEN